MVIKTYSDDDMTIPLSKFMACEKGVVEELIELFPKTAENLKQRALEKRYVYMHYMNKVLIPASQRSSNRSKINREEVIADIVNRADPETLINPSFGEDEGADQEEDGEELSEKIISTL
jgi:hypothetical protein